MEFKIERNSLKNIQPMYNSLCKFLFWVTESAVLKAAQGIVVEVNRHFAQNGRRKYDGEMCDGVPCSFVYFFLLFDSQRNFFFFGFLFLFHL